MGENRRSSLVEMIKGRWREFVREPSAFFFVVFMPILWMAILGFAFSGKGKDVFTVGWTTGVQELAGGQAAQNAKEKLAAASHFKLYEGSPEELTRLLRRGTVQVVVEMGPKSVHYAFDPANRDSARARLALNELVQGAAGRTDQLLAVDEPTEVPGSRYIDFLVPGLVGLSIMTSSLFGTGALVVVNRRENLLKRYCATPMKATDYILSHIVGRGMMLAVEVAAILIAAFLMFQFKVEGTFLALVVLALLGAAVFTSLAMLCGSRTTNMAVMNGMTNLVMVPLMIVGGVWFSRSNFPDWIETSTRYFPLTALVDGLRKVALEGAGFGALSFEMVVLAVYAVIFTAAAKALFKWY